MKRVRIWTLESDYDAETVKCLACKLVTFLNLDGFSIQSSGRNSVPRKHRRGSSKSGLKRAVQNYLREDACIIFVIDSDSLMSNHERSLQSNSLLSQVHSLLDDDSLKGKVFLSRAVQEIESWLLVDCLGVFCFFASKRKQFKENCRDKVSQNKSFMRIVKKNQRGDTQHIVEPEIGGKGAKEYLVKFSEDVLLGLNPKMPSKNVRANRYKVSMAPAIAEHVVINSQTLSCNSSLQHLGILLERLN